MNYDEKDFRVNFEPEDEWTWIDDLAYAAKTIAIIVVVVAAFGVIAWRVI